MCNKIKTQLKRFKNWIIFTVFGIGVVFAAGELPSVPDIAVEKLQIAYEQAPQIKAKYKMQNASFIKEAIDENAMQTEIGDKTLDKFTPEMILRKWDDEVNFKIKYKHNEKEKDLKFELDGEKIKLKGKKIETHFYEMDDDKYEFEIILLEKPDTNIVSFDIETKGLSFYYQPELTQAEIDEGAFRPNNIIGSYAVYHSTKRNNIIGGKEYQAGKAFHIYRPLIIDSAGITIWGVLNIENNLLTVTIPQEFLDSATYPVIVDPTFGYTTLGSSISTIGANEAIALTVYSAPIGINIPTDIRVVLYGESKNRKLVIWHPDTGAVITNSVSGAISTPTSKDWSIFTFTTAPVLDPFVKYYIGGVAESVTTIYAYDSSTQGDTQTDTTNSYASPNSWSTYGNVSGKLSAYITYTAFSGTTATSSVVSSNDDASCYSTGTALCYNSSVNVRMGYRDGVNWGDTHGGFRFTGLSIPQGATIQAARFKYFAYDTDASTDNINIYAEDADNSVAFVETNSDDNSVKNKTQTSASVAWTLPNQTDGSYYVSPEIKTVIQEVVNRAGYNSDSAISILIRNNGATENHNASTYDHSPSEAAELHIVYTTGDAATTTHPQVQSDFFFD